MLGWRAAAVAVLMPALPFPPLSPFFLSPIFPQDWWWKARLGKCYYQLGLLRDAERQFVSSLKNQVRGRL